MLLGQYFVVNQVLIVGLLVFDLPYLCQSHQHLEVGAGPADSDLISPVFIL